MWFIPMGNPYGNAHNQRSNANGIDLNRNFWGPAGSDAPPAFSQKETQAIRDLTETATADHPKKRFAVSLSFHEGEVCFNSVWNYTGTAPSDEPVFWSSRSGGNVTLAPEGLAKAYQDGCTSPGFWYTNGYDWYQTRGDTNDWSYGAWTALDTTIELNTTKAPPASQIPAYCGQHRQAVLNYMLKAFQGIHGVMTDQASGAPLDGTVTATCTASASIPVPHPYKAVYTDPVAGDFHRVLQPGTYTVTCKATGYLDTVIAGVVVTADAKTSCDCPMVSPCAAQSDRGGRHPGRASRPLSRHRADPHRERDGRDRTVHVPVVRRRGRHRRRPGFDVPRELHGRPLLQLQGDQERLHDGCVRPDADADQLAGGPGLRRRHLRHHSRERALHPHGELERRVERLSRDRHVQGLPLHDDTRVRRSQRTSWPPVSRGTATRTSTAWSSGTTYYFVVRAVSGSGIEDANTVERSGCPGGTPRERNVDGGSRDGRPSSVARRALGPVHDLQADGHEQLLHGGGLPPRRLRWTHDSRARPRS